eukprot:12304718-Alexandrium_andersonii.AAC.1
MLEGRPRPCHACSLDLLPGALHPAQVPESSGPGLVVWSRPQTLGVCHGSPPAPDHGSAAALVGRAHHP